MGGPTRRVCATYLTSPAASPKHQARTVTPGGGIHFRCAGDQHSFPRPAEFGGRSGTCPERSQRSSDITAHAHASFRTERADFFFRFAPAKGSACGCEKSLCAFPTRTPPPPPVISESACVNANPVFAGRNPVISSPSRGQEVIRKVCRIHPASHRRLMTDSRLHLAGPTATNSRIPIHLLLPQHMERRFRQMPGHRSHRFGMSFAVSQPPI
jgi:hypothetical protein